MTYHVPVSLDLQSLPIDLNRIRTPLLCEDRTSLNYVEVVHGAFPVIYILLLFYPFY